MSTLTEPRPAEQSRSSVGVELAYCVSHAPQIFLQPPEEDPEQLALVHAGYRRVAQQASDLGLDALCVVALDHMHNHFLDLVPMFTVFTGDPVVAQFNQVRVTCQANTELANGLLDHLLASGFDPAFSQREVLDHSFMVPLHFASEVGLQIPVIPIIINAYVPPQPSIRRCYDFGRTVADWAQSSGLRVGVMSTGGMSHYPGTSRFHAPDLAADQTVLGWLRSGEFERIIELTPAELDDMGMVELRTWAVALGARGDRAKADYLTYWDSGHCGYAVIQL